MWTLKTHPSIIGLMSIPAYIRHTALTILFLLATVNFTRTTLKVIESSKRLDTTEATVVALEGEKSSLEDELTYKESDEYVSLEARNKLGFAQPGEEVFVTSKVLGDTAHNVEKIKISTEYGNLRLWLNLFF